MTIPASIAAAKGAAQNHKQQLTKVHRAIDEFDQGRSPSACMEDIKKALGRKSA